MGNRTSDAGRVETLPSAERDELRTVVLSAGLPAMAKWIGCSRDALASAIAGLRVRRGTLSLIRRRTIEMQTPPGAAATPATAATTT